MGDRIATSRARSACAARSLVRDKSASRGIDETPRNRGRCVRDKAALQSLGLAQPFRPLADGEPAGRASGAHHFHFAQMQRAAARQPHAQIARHDRRREVDHYRAGAQ